MVDDAHWMRRALVHARRGLGRTTPNPLVGAVVVTADGVVVGEGAHERAGEPHAEVHALTDAGPSARGATLYCSLEPCVHTGRTGPCTARIIEAGIARVVVAMQDPFPLVNGRGIAALREHGIQVDVGVEADAARRLNRPFVSAIERGRPWVTIKAATSLDGRIAAAPGERTALTSHEANLHVQEGRAVVDAVAVGSGTVLVDDPLLTARDVYRDRPLARVVFDRRLRTPPTAKLFSTLGGGPVLVLTTGEAMDAHDARARALRDAGATLVAVGGPSLRQALECLPARGIHSIEIEGGASLHAAAWAEQLVDTVQLYIAPLWIGSRGVPLFAGGGPSLLMLEASCVDMLGPDVLIEGDVHRTH
jgi:diaminohydroxyphosphoribosylaminopyrimidine deaminase/5-amino-6-(5-phosphoribosylamino)uracil reductase